MSTEHKAYEGRGQGVGGGGYGGGGRGSLYTYRYTVTTRVTPALRWAAMRAYTVDILLHLNHFTAMLAAPSLGKRPIKTPNLKPSVFFLSLLRMST